MISEKNLVIINDKYIKKLLSDPDMEEYVQKVISLVTEIALEKLTQGFKMLHPDIGVGRETVDSEADLIYLYKDAYINMEMNMVYSKISDTKNYIYTSNYLFYNIFYSITMESFKIFCFCMWLNICSTNLFSL